MADLTADRVTPDVVNVDNVQGGYIFSYGVAATQQIYKGSFVELNAGNDIEPAGTSSITKQCLGIALENKLGGTADSDVSCLVLVGAIIQHALTSTRTDIGAAVFISDDQTLTLTRAATSGYLGQMMAIGDSANTAYIQMKMPRVMSSSVFAYTDAIEDFAWAGGATVTETNDVLGTLCRELAAQGIINATFTA